jgi:hypothetical protein
VGDRSAPHLHAALLVVVGLNKAGRISPIGLSDKAVWRLVRTAATAAGKAGAELAAVMHRTQHRSAAVAPSYVRPDELWRNNPTKYIWSQPGAADRT